MYTSCVCAYTYIQVFPCVHMSVYVWGCVGVSTYGQILGYNRPILTICLCLFRKDISLLNLIFFFSDFSIFLFFSFFVLIFNAINQLDHTNILSFPCMWLWQLSGQNWFKRYWDLLVTWKWFRRDFYNKYLKKKKLFNLNEILCTCPF